MEVYAMLIGRIIAIVFLPFCILLAAQRTLPTQTSPVQVDVATGEISPIEDAAQTEATTTNDNVVFILGNLLILSLYAFPMSYAENWAFGDPKKAMHQSKKQSPELDLDTEMPGDEAPASTVEWAKLSKRLPQWTQKYPRAKAGLAAGGCLMVVVVVVGAIAFALYYLISGQPERVSEIIPRFAYWFPFALLGMVADVPFMIIYWEDLRTRVLLRLMIWWFPRLIIIAFVINPPFLQDLDPATTALTVLAIDVVLAAFCLGLYAAREQMRMKDIQQDYDTYEGEIA
jgi:hypothetical protein